MACLLHGPITDQDLQGRNRFLFDPGTGATVLVTIPLPSSVGLAAYYPRGTTGPGGDDWVQAVTAALTAVSPDAWVGTEYGPAQPNLVRIVWGGYYPPDPGQVARFRFDQPTSTLDAHLLGLPRGVSSDAIPATTTLVSPFHLARLWRQEHPARQRALPERAASTPHSLSGRVEARSVGGWRRWRLKWSTVPGPWIWRSDAQDPQIGPVMIPGLQPGDPNVCLESCWESWTRPAPVRFTPDEDIPGTFLHLRFVGPAVGALSEAISEVNLSPPYSDIELDALEQTP